MSKTKIFKRGLVFLIVLLSTFTLVSCKKKEIEVPYGSLGDTVYLQSSSHKITEKELYKELRLSASGELEKMFYEIIFTEELDKVDTFLDKYDGDLTEVAEDDELLKEDVLDYVNSAIFGSTDISKLKELPDDRVNRLIHLYIDSLYMSGKSITVDDIDTENFTNHSNIILKHYRLSVAKRIFAREKLEEDILDKDSSVYIDIEKDIESYYKEEIKKRYPLSSINIRFTNKFEADETLRHFNIKVYRSKWYLLPDPRTTVLEGDAYDFLVDAIGADDASNFNGKLSDSNHKLYYEKYTIDTGRAPIGNEEVEKALTIDEVLTYFIKIYNTIYPYREELSEALTLENILNNANDKNFVNDDEENLGMFTKRYEDYTSSQSSLRTYIYNTLSTDEEGTRYTSSPRSYGEHYYLSFKLKDHNEGLDSQVNDNDEYILWEDEDEETLTDYSKDYYEEIKKKKLTSAYINDKATERLEDADIKIYDELLQLHLNQSGIFEYKLAKKFDNNLVATVNDKEIKVETLYEHMEKLIGASTAVDLAVKQLLLNSEYRDKIDKDKLKEYEENMENALIQFGQGAFESSGFSPEIGRRNFLILAFNSESVEEAIEKVYITAELEKLFLEDLEKHYGEEIYEFFTTYANKFREQFFSLSSSHLLIYVDIDEDDNPDNPEDFFNYLEENDKADQIDEYKDLITELMRKIYDETTRYSSFNNGLEYIVSQYNRATKIIPNDDEEDGQKEHGPDHEWAKFKEKGLMIKYQSLGTYGNQTNYPDQDGGLDENFFNRINHLYNKISGYDEATGEIPNTNDLGSNFPKQILDDKPTTYDEILESTFGWHLIVVNGAEEALSSKFTYSDDRLVDGEDYKIHEQITIKDRNDEEIILNIYNNNDGDDSNDFKAGKITSNQVRVYLYEKGTEYGLENVPSKVKSALQNYLDPVVAKFNSNYMKLHLFNNLYDSGQYTFANASNQDRILKIREISLNQFYEYTNILDQDNLYYQIYKTWFTDLEQIQK